jgi:hypothetical protein
MPLTAARCGSIGAALSFDKWQLRPVLKAHAKEFSHAKNNCDHSSFGSSITSGERRSDRLVGKDKVTVTATTSRIITTPASTGIDLGISCANLRTSLFESSRRRLIRAAPPARRRRRNLPNFNPALRRCKRRSTSSLGSSGSPSLRRTARRVRAGLNPISGSRHCRATRRKKALTEHRVVLSPATRAAIPDS